VFSDGGQGSPDRAFQFPVVREHLVGIRQHKDLDMALGESRSIDRPPGAEDIHGLLPETKQVLGGQLGHSGPKNICSGLKRGSGMDAERPEEDAPPGPVQGLENFLEQLPPLLRTGGGCEIISQAGIGPHCRAWAGCLCPERLPRLWQLLCRECGSASLRGHAACGVPAVSSVVRKNVTQSCLMPESLLLRKI